MKHRIALAALALTMAALNPGRAHAQASTRPASSVQERAALGNPHARRGVAATFGFTWGMTPTRGPNRQLAYGYPVVRTVVKGAAAERAGLAANDVILAVNGRDARLTPLFPNMRPGARYVVRVRRGIEERELTYAFPATHEAGAPPR